MTRRKDQAHLTERGALLDKLPHERVAAGHYEVEGYTVRHVVRRSKRRYLVKPRVGEGWRVDRWEITAPWIHGRPVRADTFTEALQWIADQPGHR
jgi:DNA-binding FadR family transcriptional regulator